MFSHLKLMKISYSNHFFRAIKISFMCLQASYYLFIHAIYPDVYQFHGTEIIKKVYYEYCLRPQLKKEY
jgi:hypothetical protein